MKTRLCLTLVAALACAGCNQYSTPAIQSTTATGGAAAGAAGNGVTGRSVDPLNSQADPGETTGSLGGSPAGTASSQTAPSSSDGVR